jgi:hypothetical protein
MSTLLEGMAVRVTLESTTARALAIAVASVVYVLHLISVACPPRLRHNRNRILTNRAFSAKLFNSERI